jgi:hypothetical protein
MRTALALALAAALTLGACDRKDEGAGKAEGEILPGSTSDAMLPYDSVRSQPPLAPKAQASAKAEAEQPEDAASDAPAAPEAAAEPAAEAPN